MYDDPMPRAAMLFTSVFLAACSRGAPRPPCGARRFERGGLYEECPPSPSPRYAVDLLTRPGTEPQNAPRREALSPPGAVTSVLRLYFFSSGASGA